MIVSKAEAGPAVGALGRACARAQISWAAFFTNKGVEVLGDGEVVRALATARRAVACQESWAEWMADAECPVERGSQTSNSELVGVADRVVSL